MNFQIRLSDTGHSQRISLQAAAKGEQLIKYIGNQYKIDSKDQLLLTKIGHIIKPQQHLGKVLTDVRGDKTLASKGFKQGVKVSTESLHCIYVFNLKEMKKSKQKVETGQMIQRSQKKEKGEKKQNNYWLDKLKQKLHSILNLRPAITAYDSLADIFPIELMKNHNDITDRINSLRNSLIQLDSFCIELKEIHAEVEDIIQRCAIQKKSLHPLNSSLIDCLKMADKKAQNLNKLIDKLKQKTLVDDKSLRQNSGCFQNKKRQDLNVSFYEEKILCFKTKGQGHIKNIKQSIRACKDKFRRFDLQSVQFAKLNINEEINTKFKVFREDYHKILECFKQFEGSRQFNSKAKLQNYIKQLERSLKQNFEELFGQFYKRLTDYYIDFSEINEQNRVFVKEAFEVFESSKNIISQYKLQISSEQKNLLIDLKKYESSTIREPSFIEKNSQVQQKSYVSGGSEKSLQSFKLSIKMEAQMKRRLIFYKKINYLQTFADKMCLQEQDSRKKYANEHKSGKEGPRQLLKNIKVPSVDIDYGGTTDLDLFKHNKIANIDTQNGLKSEQFMIIEYGKIIEKINNIIGQDSNTKIKNLKIILTTMSDIFVKIFNEKVEVIKAQKQIIEVKNTELQAKIVTLEQNLLKNNQLKEEMQKIINQKQKLLIDLQKNLLEDIGKEKSRTEKAIADKKKLQINLQKQIRLTEQLQNHFILMDKENELNRQQYEQMKIMFGERQIEIIKLQKQINDLKSQNKLVQTPSMNEFQLKSVVLQNFSKNENESNNFAQQIQKLNQQILILQNQNEQLKVQNEQLIFDLNEIIRKQTEDVEVQVDDLDIPQKEFNMQGITIGEQIKIGQTAIFMPFSSNVYVGVYHKDEDRTLCNMSNLHQSNYLLDLSSFSIKIRELLSQCSFLTIIKVNDIYKDGTNYIVRGNIEHLLGFEDDNLAVKDYASVLYG